MSNSITKLSSATYNDNFAFQFVGCLISHDKRFFETLHSQMLEYQEVLMESEFMNNREDRVAFMETMSILQEMTQSTRNLSEKQLDKEFVEVLELLGFKKEKEVANA